MKPLVWLITGCSSGFGNSLSLTALKAGHKVIATSRNPSKDPELVKEVEDLGGIWLPLDVQGSAADFAKVVDDGKQKFGTIDVLVNNAATSIIGAFEDVSPTEAHGVFETNVFGPMRLIQAVLPTMRAQKSGVIVNISSAVGINPQPSMSIYGSSKLALEGLSQGLAVEVAPLGIRVLIVQPGAFTTNIMNAAKTTENPITEDYKSTDVGKWVKYFEGETTGYAAPNDVDKGCQGIFEAVTGTGRGAGKEKLLRMPLSTDVAERTKQQSEMLLEGYEAWKPIWESTLHDGGVLKAFVPKK